jgi:hypothetical protein
MGMEQRQLAPTIVNSFSVRRSLMKILLRWSSSQDDKRYSTRGALSPSGGVRAASIWLEDGGGLGSKRR